MSVEFQMDYEAMMAAANTLENTSTEFTNISGMMGTVAQNLQGQYLVGQTGAAAAGYVDRLQNRIQVMISRTNEMRADLLQTLAEFRGDIDPGIASSFEG